MEDSIVMNGGDGPNSYTQNSKLQEEGINSAKLLLIRSIEEEVEIPNNSPLFTIADLGCSVGPNTLTCIQTIIEAVQSSIKTHHTPEFQVFFNDVVSNDFNTLFKSLPVHRQYMAAGVPGSFHGRLFPQQSIHLMHSSFALHWLTKVPDQVTKEESPAWNKGRITYAISPTQVVEAFKAQFFTDSKAFFDARSVELSSNGLMVVLSICRPEGTPPSESFPIHLNECLGDALIDMVEDGLLSKTSIDSFNIPMYVPTTSEVKEVVMSCNHLNIQKMEEIWSPLRLSTPEDIRILCLHARAVLESNLCNHFGSQFMDELFERYLLKVQTLSKTPRFTRFQKAGYLFLLVKRDVCQK